MVAFLFEQNALNYSDFRLPIVELNLLEWERAKKNFVSKCKLCKQLDSFISSQKKCEILFVVGLKFNVLMFLRATPKWLLLLWCTVRIPTGYIGLVYLFAIQQQQRVTRSTFNNHEKQYNRSLRFFLFNYFLLFFLCKATCLCNAPVFLSLSPFRRAI